MQNAKLRVIFFGTPDFVLPVLQSLHESFQIIAIVTTPDTIQGRKKLLTPPPAKQFAEKYGIPVFQPEKLRGDDPLDLPEAELYAVAAYGKIIPDTILKLPVFGAINIHPSLLPKYRGPSPIQSMLLSGDTETGISFMVMDQKMDHGPILAQKKLQLNGDETFASLHESMFQAAAELLPGIITDYIEGKITPIPQNDEAATYCKMITKEDGYFYSEAPPEHLERMIRAFYPWPTAWTRMSTKDGKKILKLLPEGKVQLEGTKPMTVKDLLNGHPELRDQIQKILNLK